MLHGWLLVAEGRMPEVGILDLGKINLSAGFWPTKPSGKELLRLWSPRLLPRLLMLPRCCAAGLEVE